jgi:hypothetical protein
MDQVDPFHDSIKVWSAVLARFCPTAMQAEELLQETPTRESRPVLETLGLGTIDQADPFHDSIRV